MDPRPRVSVVIPFYDSPTQFIREAIESVLAQTYTEWELLLVDDGSLGESTAVARSYAARHGPKVIYLDHAGHRNRGHSASRNLGIEHAKGQYLALLDADDVWLPHKLTEQVALLDANPEPGMLYGNTLYWYSWSANPADRDRDFIPKLGVPPGTVVEPPRLLTLFLEGRTAVPCTCSVLARTEVIRRVGGFVESARGLYEDQIFYAKLCLEAPVLVTGACWDLYRQHRESLCNTASKAQQRESRERFLNWLTRYLSEHGIRDRAVWRALRREQWEVRQPSLARLLRTGGRLSRRARRAWPGRRGDR